ncbi:IS66 family insertion sequence element accessory protein TnpB [Bacillus sp. FJAT-47783]|uniref:IS66 family insertion sequence element accessory protein TnpA n=1 Tax=Bacillus sp. FJAT-47783 TaxID=2922712 RepID=UPI001FABAE21|nr:IS66 family insertion sequence element accessory protein TnpB [Bacillus sp. FJAT-47783]
MAKSPNSELRKEWERRIADYKASGQTQAKWCESNDISIHQFKYWLKKIKDHHNTVKANNLWVPVVIEEPKTKQEVCESLQIKVGSVSIEVTPGFNPSLLAEVIKVLTEREC